MLVVVSLSQLAVWYLPNDRPQIDVRSFLAGRHINKQLLQSCQELNNAFYVVGLGFGHLDRLVNVISHVLR